MKHFSQLLRFQFLAALMALFLASCTPEPGRVKVEGGWIQGTVLEDMTVYKGIPFAAPPVGDLRWKAPQPVIPWEGVKETTDFANSPVQWGKNPWGNSEDCLYLNIWTPAKSPKEKLPVMVWIYGGGFGAGTTTDPLFDGTAFARDGVIVVTTAYRVGKLGFLAHPGLSAESPDGVSGNYGLLDQIAGLQWVQQNIAAFGGDPSKVTIFGESAGGISVSMLCASPLAKGLFRGAISQSGGSFGPTRPTTYPGENMKTLAQAEAEGVKIAESLGVSTVEELRALPAERFVERGLAVGGGWPIVDGHVIPDDQYRMYERGEYNDVAVIAGYNSDEGASFSRNKDGKVHQAELEERYGPFAGKLLEAYPLENGTVTHSARNLMRDAAFGWHTWSWCRLQARTGKAPAYLYYFDQHPEHPADSPMYGFGSPHGQDIAYVFQKVDPERAIPGDKELMQAMGKYWTNFAKTGDPNGPGLPAWPAFDNGNPQAMYLSGAVPYAGPVPDEAALNVLDEYFRWRRSPEGTAWAR